MLKFPSDKFYGDKCPFVVFTPKKYEFPFADSKKGKVELKNFGGGISAVSLYLPGNFDENMGASWGDQSILGGPEDSISGKIANELTNATKDLFGGKVAGLVSAETGKTPMPMDLLVYSGPAPISLKFSFQLLPVSSSENATIQQIVRNFKRACIPQKATLGVLNYPAIWEINFLGISGLGYGDSNNYKWMALESVSVTFSGGDSNIHVYDSDKLPTIWNLSLQFKCITKFMD